MISKAKRVLGVIKKPLANIDASTMPLPCRTRVSRVEYSSACWGPFNRMDRMLERAQRRISRMHWHLERLFLARTLTLPEASLSLLPGRGDGCQLLHGFIDQSPYPVSSWTEAAGLAVASGSWSNLMCYQGHAAHSVVSVKSSIGTPWLSQW